MKYLKNISLVYTLQVIAVLILFFIPDTLSKAALKKSTISNIVTNHLSTAAFNKMLFPTTFTSKIFLGTANFILPEINSQKNIKNRPLSNIIDDQKSLSGKYHIDAFALNQLGNMHLKPPNNTGTALQNKSLQVVHESLNR